MNDHVLLEPIRCTMPVPCGRCYYCELAARGVHLAQPRNLDDFMRAVDAVRAKVEQRTYRHEVFAMGWRKWKGGA